MADPYAHLALGAIGATVAFAAVYLTVPPLARYLEARGMCVPDVNKKGSPPVARPGGPAILAGMVCGCIPLMWYDGGWTIPAMVLTVSAAFVIGYVDDRRVMSGWFKPLALCLAALPLLLAGGYDTALEFPPFGAVQIPVLYAGVILAIVSTTGNTVNSIDVMNGVASGYVAMAAGAVCVVLAMLGRWEALALGMILVAASLAFYRYHRIPSRIFPGDSGALVLGVSYGCLAIYGGVEVVAAVALLPAVANSFLFLSSVRRIVEHRQIGRAAVVRDESMRLRDTGDPQAPVTLVRLILRRGPMTEAQIVREIFRLGTFSAGLAVLTGIMMVAS